MRKIHITESQLLYCLNHLNEATNQGAGIKRIIIGKLWQAN